MRHATRIGSAALLIILIATGARAGDTEDADVLAGYRKRLHTLAEAVAARLDEADAARVRERERRSAVTDREFAVTDAEAAHAKAKVDVESAEMAVKTYEELTFKKELITAEGAIQLAEAEAAHAAKRGKDASRRLDEAKALVGRIAALPKETAADTLAEYMAGSHRESAEWAVESAKFAEERAALSREQAEVQKHVLVTFTKEIRLKELKANVELARSKALRLQAKREVAQHALALLQRDAPGPAAAGELTGDEQKALDAFAAIGPPWRAIRSGGRDAKSREEVLRRLAEFERSMTEAERAWASAQDARRAALAEATLDRFQGRGR